MMRGIMNYITFVRVLQDWKSYTKDLISYELPLHFKTYWKHHEGKQFHMTLEDIMETYFNRPQVVLSNQIMSYVDYIQAEDFVEKPSVEKVKQKELDELDEMLFSGLDDYLDEDFGDDWDV